MATKVRQRPRQLIDELADYNMGLAPKGACNNRERPGQQACGECGPCSTRREKWAAELLRAAQDALLVTNKKAERFWQRWTGKQKLPRDGGVTRDHLKSCLEDVLDG